MLTGQVTFSDDIESYTAGDFIAASSPDWRTWSGTTVGADDNRVSAAQASSGVNSLFFSSTAAAGGPVDIVLPFGAKYTSGLFTMSFNILVDEGASAYWNFQGEVTPGGTWTHHVYLLDDGTANFANSGNVTALASNFTAGEWMNISYRVDLTNNFWQISLNGECIGSFSNEANNLASMNLYPTLNNAYHIDDVMYAWQEDVESKQFDASLNTNDLGVGGFTGMTQEIAGSIQNAGTDMLLDATVRVSFPTEDKDYTFENINLEQGESFPFTIPDLYELAEGDNGLYMEIIDINSGGIDEDPCNSKASRQLLGVTPAEGKNVIVEEGTGTWCGWCPRGAVFLDRLSTKYQERFIGIAVHNGDPMVVTGYDGALGFSGYPSATVMRQSANVSFGSQADLELPFLQFMAEAPIATFDVGAEFDEGDPTLMRISIEVNAMEKLTRFNRLVFMIVEDGVTGTTANYAQSNYYAGGGNGAMGGYETLPSNVPAADMVYDHDARAIPIGVDGDGNAFTGNMEAGTQKVLTYEYSVPEDYDQSEMHIVVGILDLARDLQNGFSISFEDAVSNGLLTATSDLTAVEKVEVLPNPVSNVLQLTINNATETALTIELVDMQGTTIQSEKIVATSGTTNYSTPISQLNSGAYMAVLRSDEGTSVVKFVKK